VLVLSLMVAQAAKADDVLFNDLGDVINVSGSSALTIVPGTCQNQITGTPNLDVCSVMLLRTGQTIISATGNFTINLNSPTPVQATYLLSEDANKTLLSDTFLSTIVPGVNVLGVITLPGTAAFVFDSDLPALEGVPVPCPAVIGCNAAETGGPQLVGTITWSGGTTDRIFIESDKEGVVPEPATLILLGSGLAMTGGFLRRRLLSA
jgi:PEP-CTERM motif